MRVLRLPKAGAGRNFLRGHRRRGRGGRQWQCGGSDRGVEWDPANHSPHFIMASPHLASMRPEELTNLTDAIDQVADTTRGAGPLDLEDREGFARIRKRFKERLSTWYMSYKREAAAILELALWKIEVGWAAEGGRWQGATPRPETTAESTAARIPSSASSSPPSPARIVPRTKGKIRD